MKSVLHISSWYPSENYPIEGKFVKEFFDAVNSDGRHELWHIQVRYDGRFIAWQKKKTGSKEYRAILYCRVKQGRVVEWLTYMLLIVLRLRLGRRWWDVVHVHIAYPILRFPRLFQFLYGRQVVISEHWSAYHSGFNLPENSKARRRIYQIFHFGIPVIAVSKTLAKDIIRFAKTDKFSSYVIPNVVDPYIFYSSNLPRVRNCPIFLMVGNWSFMKRPLLALEAFTNILDDFPMCRLRIIGDGVQMEAMKRFVSVRNLNHQIEFVGTLDKFKIAEEMRNADCLLHPTDYETFSIVCAEAICCSLPIIASNVGAIPELVNSNNGMLIGNSIAEWECAIKELVTSNFSLTSMTQKFSNNYQFSPSNIKNIVNDIYDKHSELK